MTILQRIDQKNMSRYRLSKLSGVPLTTINDICSGKSRIEKCSADTLYRIAKVLDVTMEELVEESMEYRSSFETFKSNVCHLVRDKGDLNFIADLLESDDIRKHFEKKWYPEALYLLAMLDYLSRVNDIPLCTQYEDIRSAKLQEPIYPSSAYVASLVTKNPLYLRDAEDNAIPEFRRYNIIESEVRDVC